MDKYFKLLDSLQARHEPAHTDTDGRVWPPSRTLSKIFKKHLLTQYDVSEEADYIIRTWESSKRDSLLNELENTAKSHDWWYRMSDDHRVYTNGTDQAQEMDLLVKALTEKGLKKEASRILNKYMPDEMKLSREG